MKQQNENENYTTNNKVVSPPPFQFNEFRTKFVIQLFHSHHHYQNHHYTHHQLAAEEEEDEHEHNVADEDEDKEEYSIGSNSTRTCSNNDKTSLHDMIYQPADQEAEIILNSCN